MRRRLVFDEDALKHDEHTPLHFRLLESLEKFEYTDREHSRLERRKAEGREDKSEKMTLSGYDNI